MKHAVALAWSTGTIVFIALIVLLGMRLTVWSGPSLDVSAEGSKAKVESVFLGDYQLGVTRLRIESDAAADSLVVDIADSRVGQNSLLVRTVSTNQSLSDAVKNMIVLAAVLGAADEDGIPASHSTVSVSRAWQDFAVTKRGYRSTLRAPGANRLPK